MIDFLFDTSKKDLDLTRGLQFADGIAKYEQALLFGLSLNLGEFFTHINHGLPWLRAKDSEVSESIRYLLGSNFPHPEIYIASELDKHIKKISFVKTLESSYNFDRQNRVFTYNFKIETEDGLLINFQPYEINI